MNAVEQAIAARAASLARHFDQLGPWLDLPEPAWSTRPAPESWSPAEIVEHLALMHHFVLLLAEKIAARGLRRAAAGAPLPEVPSDVSKLQELASTSFRWTHPSHMTPSGKRNRVELRRELAEQRERLQALATRAPRGEGALHTVRMSLIEGRLDLYQFLALVDLHLERHLAQLERALSSLEPGRRATDAPGT